MFHRRHPCDDAVASGLAEAAEFDAGLAALARSAGPGGTFCYTVLKGVGRKLGGSITG